MIAGAERAMAEIVEQNRPVQANQTGPAELKCFAVYSAQVLDHFQNPRNTGDVPNPDASAQVDNPVCGDILKLTLRVMDGHISEIRFRAKGCVPSMACGSLLTEIVKGKTPAEARKLTREDLITAIGALPEASSHAAHLAIDALNIVLRGL